MRVTGPDRASCGRDPVRPSPETPMRSILLLLLGVPLPIVILIALFSH
jgi:hypothetical protein